MLKAGFFVVVFLTVAGVAIAQQTSVAVNFEKNKTKYTREHLAMGEDASSGYDYLFYKKGAEIVMIRSIWSASYTKDLRIEDVYFDGDRLALVTRSTGHKRNLATLKRGRNVVLKPKEELHFTDSKLTRWIENGKPVVKTDARWADMERSTIEHANSERESYTWMKEGN